MDRQGATAALAPPTAMSERPPVRFYVIGLTSLALLVVGFVLSVDDSDTALAAVLGVLGALGMFASALIIKRHQRTRP
jgi:F0F1-type ATP synthase assembly protein I